MSNATELNLNNSTLLSGLSVYSLPKFKQKWQSLIFAKKKATYRSLCLCMCGRGRFYSIILHFLSRRTLYHTHTHIHEICSSFLLPRGKNAPFVLPTRTHAKIWHTSVINLQFRKNVTK